MLQSTFNSKLLNLGQVSASNTPAGAEPHLRPIRSLLSCFTQPLNSLSSAPQQVDARSLGSLYAFLRERRPLLVSLNTGPPQDLNRLPYATLRTLRVHTLVHALLRVTHTHLSTGEGVIVSHCVICMKINSKPVVCGAVLIILLNDELLV